MGRLARRSPRLVCGQLLSKRRSQTLVFGPRRQVQRLAHGHDGLAEAAPLGGHKIPIRLFKNVIAEVTLHVNKDEGSV